MAALSADSKRDIAHAPRLVWSFPVLASTTIYKSGLVSLDSTGYLVMATDSGTDLLCVGIAAEGVVNSGGDGDAYCKVASGLLCKFTTGTIALTDQGAAVYVSDSDTVDLVAVKSNVLVGFIYEFVTTTTARIFIPVAGVFTTTINTGDITNLAVTAAKLASNSVETAKITALNVTTAKIALDNIDETLIADEAIQNEHYKDVTLDQTAGALSVAMVIEIHANAGAASYDYACARDLRCIDFHVIAKATNGGGTAMLNDHAGNAISDAVACATDLALARAATFDDDNIDEVSGQNLNVTQNAAADNGLCYIWVLPTA